MRTKEMVYWITERERMRKRWDNHQLNANQKIPCAYGFSNDPTMGTVRYCNVRREDDKVTRWMAENWRPQHHAVWEIVLARMLNYIPTLQSIIDFADPPWDLDGIASGLKAKRECGEKIFTSAYTISTCGQRMGKIDYVMGVVAEVKERPNWPWEVAGGAELLGDCSLHHAHLALTRINGLGSFLAAQVVADLKNTAGHPLQQAQDWQTWAAPGPGSLRGLTAFYGRPITSSQFTKAITACWLTVKPHLTDDLQDLHMQDFQNCLCEFSKYIKIKEGKGHARNRYSPG